jgi:hypothetical protein
MSQLTSVTSVNMVSHRHSLPAMDQLWHQKLHLSAATANKDHPDLLDHLEMMVRLALTERMDRMQLMDVMDKC